MFERYTEKARRVIFFARYEASQYGSKHIETEHILLGLLREDSTLTRRVLPAGSAEKIREAIDARSPRKPILPTSADLPLASGSKRVLTLATKEADEIGRGPIGTGHLLLALIQEKECVAAEILREFGAQYEKAKEFVREFSPAEGQNEFAPLSPHLARIQRLRSAIDPRTVRIHNTEHDVEFVRAGVIFCRGMLWHWAKKTWRPQDIVVCRSDGRISFDLSLAEDTANFQLVQNGWNHDVCKICNWRLYVTPETEHSTGYTNGKIWVCVECYEKFVSGADYFATAYPEIT